MHKWTFDCFVNVWACVPHGRLIVDCKVTQCVGKVFAALSPVLWFVIGALEGTSEGRLLTGGGVSCGVVEGPRRGATDGAMLGTVEIRAGVAPLGMSAVIVGEPDGEAVGEPDGGAVGSALKDGIGDGAAVGVAEGLPEGVQVPSTLTCIAVMEPSCVAYTTTSP